MSVFPDQIDLLDLCILAYQLHAQTLVMRADPYGEYMRSKTAEGKAANIGGRKRRKRFLDAVRLELANLQPRPSGPSFGGPGCVRNPSLTVWPPNDQLDPILSDYTRISPQLPGLVQPYKHHEGWIVYRAPASITASIGKTFMVEYDSSQGPTSKQCTVNLVPSPLGTPALGPDLLYCFEGGTGARRNQASDGAIWSLMGFVLMREDLTQKPPPYDVFVVFRGSRSGRMGSVPLPRMASYFLAKGNPDWVTDLDLKTTTGRPEVSSDETHRGFATAMQTMLPTIEAALAHYIAGQQQQRPPRAIYVTGHSLGGALATCFASAVLRGSFGKGLKTPNWPWAKLSITTFGAPPAGKLHFARQLNAALTGNAESWRLKNDIVPTTATKLLPNWWPTGRDIPLDAADLDKEAAHSPDHIRIEMENFLQLNKPAGTPPWTVQANLDDLLVLVSAEIAKLSAKDWFNFRKGLGIYLTAISQMRERKTVGKPGPRFDPNEITVIQNFLTQLGTQNLATTFSNFMNSEFLKLSEVQKIWAEDRDLNYHIRVWLALVAAEDGYTWKNGDPLLNLVVQ